MAILLTCPNGHKLSVPDQHAGKKARCSVCKAVVPIPAAQAPVPIEEAMMPMEITDVREPQAMMITDIHEEEAMTPVIEEGDGPEYARVMEAGAEGRTKKRKKKDITKILEKKERRKRRNRIQAVRIVNLGLAFHYVPLLLMEIGILLAMGILVSIYIAIATGAIGGLGIAGVLSKIVNIDSSIAMPLLGLVGSILCVWIPGESKARPFIIISLSLDVAQFPIA